jgi:uncharacterized protein DUF4339
MKLYFLKLYGGEEGPHAEAQIAQMFADGQVNRDTPCKPADGGDWKTIDDYLPILKYGTQLPPPVEVRSVPPPVPSVLSPSQRVSVVDFDIPFGSVLKIVFKWMAAAFIVGLCFLPVAILIWLIIMAVFAGLMSDAMSTLHQP